MCTSYVLIHSLYGHMILLGLSCHMAHHLDTINYNFPGYYPNMPALCGHNGLAYYALKYAGIIDGGLSLQI